MTRHSYEKSHFDSWQRTSWDVNDGSAPRNLQTGDPRTDPDIAGYVAEYFNAMDVPEAAALQTWHAQRIGGALGADEQNAAERAAAHADTPTAVHFDALGRVFLTVARNRVICQDHPLDGIDEEFRTRIELDIEGNQRTRLRRTQTAGRRQPAIGRFQSSALLSSTRTTCSATAFGCPVWKQARDGCSTTPRASQFAPGQPRPQFHDEVRRIAPAIEHYVRGAFSDPDPLKPNSDPRTLGRDILVDKIEYGEGLANAEALNLCARLYRHSDSTGIVTNARLDDAGNPTEAYDFEESVAQHAATRHRLYRRFGLAAESLARR